MLNARNDHTNKPEIRQYWLQLNYEFFKTLERTQTILNDTALSPYALNSIFKCKNNLSC